MKSPASKLFHFSNPRCALTLLLMSVLANLVAGCHSCDLVEAELRTRENELRELRDELGRAEAQNEALMRETCTLRHGGPVAITPELAAQVYTVRRITLGRGTGGYADDNCPGDQALQVVLEP